MSAQPADLVHLIPSCASAGRRDRAPSSYKDAVTAGGLASVLAYPNSGA